MPVFTSNPGVTGNSTKQPQDNKPQVEKVIDTGFKVKPKSKAEAFKEAFLPSDWAVAAKTGFTNTIVPGVKNILLQSLIATFTGMLYGGMQSPPPNNFTPRGGYTPYYQYGGYTTTQTQTVQQAPQQPPKRPEYYQVTLPIGQMDMVKQRMLEYANEYGWCSVGVFYDLIGITCVYTDRLYGWTAQDIMAATVMHSHVDNGQQMFKLNIVQPKPRTN